MAERGETEVSEAKMPLWQVRNTCWVSTEKQCTEGWARKRIGCIQASIIAKVCGRANFGAQAEKQSPEELARIICGLSEQSFSTERLSLMDDGIRGEPMIKEWFADKIIKRPITDVGVAVWKSNPYFRASLDGETTNDAGQAAAVEVKIPAQLNKLYIDVLQSWGKKLNNPHPSEYIFASHYDQMTAGSVITDKHGCYYIVACIRDGTCFHQYLDTNYEHWNDVLYPKAEAFRLKYVVPLIEKHGLQVIMPPGAESVQLLPPRSEASPLPPHPRRSSLNYATEIGTKRSSFSQSGEEKPTLSRPSSLEEKLLQRRSSTHDANRSPFGRCSPLTTPPHRRTPSLDGSRSPLTSMRTPPSHRRTPSWEVGSTPPHLRRNSSSDGVRATEANEDSSGRGYRRSLQDITTLTPTEEVLTPRRTSISEEGLRPLVRESYDFKPKPCRRNSRTDDIVQPLAGLTIRIADPNAGR